MPKSHARGVAANSPRVQRALKQNKKVAKEVKEAADELGVVHAVLDTKVPEDARHEDVDGAIARTNELGKRLDKSAEILGEVSDALEREAQASEAPQDRSDQGGAKRRQ